MLAALVVSVAAFTLDGHRLLGLMAAAVRAALGPSRGSRTRGRRYLALQRSPTGA